jgi:hypothetical protein
VFDAELGLPCRPRSAARKSHWRGVWSDPVLTEVARTPRARAPAAPIATRSHAQRAAADAAARTRRTRQLPLDGVLARSVRRRPGTGARLQRYFEGSAMGMADGVRLSERGMALLAGKKELYAAEELIAEGNEQLKDRRLVLAAGAEYDKNDFAGTISRGAGKPLFRVIPRLRPSKQKQVDPLLKALDQLNPAPEDSVSQLGVKNERYRAFVTEQMDYVKELVDETLAWLSEESKGVTNINFPLSRKQYDAFVNGRMRTWLADNPIAKNYVNEARLYVTTGDGELLPSFADIASFASTASDMRRRVLRVELDRAAQDEIILPTDCFTAALAMGATHTKDKPLPGIGETHYVALGSDTGWNNHWATVIMRDGMDTVTLENAADPSKGPLDRTSWWFGIYGTRKAGQSFEEEYRALSEARSSGIAKRLDEIAAARTTPKRLEYTAI